jgi:FkbM family methyltransferase
MRSVQFLAARWIGRLVPSDRVASLVKYMFLRELFLKTLIDYVIDVGANEGQFATALRQLGYRGQIVSFEPVTEVFDILSSVMKRDRKWKGYNCALGDTDTRAKINVMASSVYSSFNTPVDHQNGGNQVVRTSSVQVRRLDSILESTDLSHTLLKVDTQGYEMPVFRGLGDKLTGVRAILCEISVNPLYSGTPPMTDVIVYLNKNGFKSALFAPIGRVRDLSALEFDYLCVRP